MRLTRFSDIGLRVLIYLSRTDSARAIVTVSEVASQFDIPLNHLVKVVGELVRNGWIQATRGRKGGIRLNVEPASLKVGAVLRVLEGDSELVDCESLKCDLHYGCVLRGALRSGLNAFYDAMDRYTLADIAGGQTGQQIIMMHHRFLHGDLNSDTNVRAA